MDDRESSRSAAPEAGLERIMRRFRRWWRPRNPAEQYLSAATDLEDLERRMRILDRASAGPVFVTFNH